MVFDALEVSLHEDIVANETLLRVQSIQQIADCLTPKGDSRTSYKIHLTSMKVKELYSQCDQN